MSLVASYATRSSTRRAAALRTRRRTFQQVQGPGEAQWSGTLVVERPMAGSASHAVPYYELGAYWTVEQDVRTCFNLQTSLTRLHIVISIDTCG